jgi:hypothetical protein
VAPSSTAATVHKKEKALTVKGMAAMRSKLFLLSRLTPIPSFARKYEEKRAVLLMNGQRDEEFD